ncbi:hypothetical protein BEV13_01795 [Rickettsiella grylli]|uniref:hypothetical protein n=1 Tax=Rickettsiella grylli TaxID=59196 RepID=UPI0008FD53DC|nr:hypothetical protein [Rickettsiella grylli]OJA00925.1 hypothetical protein BEV13_01795 [Rickettsiella grylli]
MLFNYEKLIDELSYFLLEKHPRVTLSSDIFEHAFLRFLGYHAVPEKCLFTDNPQRPNLFVYLRTPYQVSMSHFMDDLRACMTGTFSAIGIENIDPHSNQERFCIRLNVPYTLIEDSLLEIFQTINRILADPLKMDFYYYWDVQVKKFNADLTMRCIENLICGKLLRYPHVTIDDVWCAIIQKNSGKKSNITFLEKKVFVDVNRFPKIILIYKENEKINELSMTRTQIVRTLVDTETLDPIFMMNTSLQEFIIPVGINQFMKEKYHRFFSVNKEGQYEIDLGYHTKEKKILEKYGIKELSSYQLPITAERSRYYCYDNNNYQRALLALKEIKGEECVDERWHQLTYYINHHRWETLNKEIKFLLNLKKETGVEIDYTHLLIRLYQHARDSLHGEQQENTFKVVEEVSQSLTCEMPLQNERQKEIYTILFELTLMRLSQLENSDAREGIVLKEKLFIFSQKAGLKESNLYLAEMAGLAFGSTFSANVCDNPLAVLIELAKRNKATHEENIRLNTEIARLSAMNSLQEKTTPLQRGTTAYFTR